MTRVLLLTRYSEMGASSRLRTLQYLPMLESLGFDIQVHSLLGDDYLEALYNKRKTHWKKTATSYATRFRQICSAGDFDVIWLEKEAFPWLPLMFEYPLFRHRVVVDYDDAIFHRYDQHSNPLVRTIFGSKIHKLMQQATVVVAGSKYLQQHAQQAGAQQVELIPTSVDITKYQAVESIRQPFVAGWIGTPKTAHFLSSIAPALQQLHARGDVSYRFIGAPQDLNLGVPFTAVPWHQETEVAEIRKFSCGLMPLSDGPFERGKCAYKLIQYMACGLPVIASPVGANNDVVTGDVNGFLPSTTAQWVSALEMLKKDPEVGLSFGKAGRRLVVEQFNTTNAMQRMATLLQG